MIGYAKKKRGSVSGAQDLNRSGRNSAMGGVLPLNLNALEGGSRSQLSSRSGLNSARGYHPPISLLPNAAAEKNGDGGMG